MLLIGVGLVVGVVVGGVVGYIIGSDDRDRIASENYDLRHRIHLEGENPDVALREWHHRNSRHPTNPPPPKPRSLMPSTGATDLRRLLEEQRAMDAHRRRGASWLADNWKIVAVFAFFMLNPPLIEAVVRLLSVSLSVP